MQARYALGILCGIFLSIGTYAQNTTTSGSWTDPSVWSGGAVPAAGGTVNVNNPLNILSNLSPTGDWTFNSNATDQPGGTAYTFNPGAGNNDIIISAGATVSFEGGTAGTPNQFNSGQIEIYGTLILGYTDINNSFNLDITIHPGGTMIVNGDLTNSNNFGSFTVNGSLIVNGGFYNDGFIGGVGGTGSIETTGPITSNGFTTVFGSANPCTSGPCSGSSLSCTFDNYTTTTAGTICTGSSVTLTSNAGSSNMPTGPTYQWLSSTDNVTFNNAPGTSTNSTYNTGALAQSTWFKVQITSNGPCTSTSAARKITVLANGGWLGATNSWSTASNWCGNAVPVATTDVVITNGTGIANMPVIASGTAAVCRDLTISFTTPASSITINAAADASLSVNGNLTNNGTLTDNSTAAAAGLKFTGSTAQAVSGSTAVNVRNLTIANTSGEVTLSGNNLSVQSNLTATSGIVNLNGLTLTLGTSAAATGTLAYTAGRFYGGNIERWYPTSTVAIATNASLFPVGTSVDYRPMWIASTGLSAAGGTIKARHTGVTGATAVSPTYTDNGGTVILRSNSYWTVSTGNGVSSTGTPLSMRTEGTGFGTVVDVNHLRQSLINSISPGSDGAHAGSTSNPRVNRTGLSVANLSNNFYWASTVPGTTLPVTVVDFAGEAQAEVIELTWITESEKNFDHFSIEKSIDGGSFQEIGTVGGRGTTTVRNQYQFLDVNPMIGRNFYRLSVIDLDGTIETFGVIRVDYRQPQFISFFPIPTASTHIQYQTNFALTGDETVTISNQTGAVVATGTFEPSTQQITFSRDLDSGLYFLQYSDGTTSKVVRVVVR